MLTGAGEGASAQEWQEGPWVEIAQRGQKGGEFLPQGRLSTQTQGLAIGGAEAEFGHVSRVQGLSENWPKVLAETGLGKDGRGRPGGRPWRDEGSEGPDEALVKDRVRPAAVCQGPRLTRLLLRDQHLGLGHGRRGKEL